MTRARLTQLASAVDSRFGDCLDLSNAGPAPLEAVLRTRGLAALAVQLLTGEDPAVAAASVIDGFDDNGIDAIFLDEASPRLILVQSKWYESPNKSISLADAHRFINGVRVLTDEQYERFNGRLDGMAPRIREILRRPGLRIEMVVATTGSHDFSEHVRLAFADACRTFNEPDEMLHVQLLTLDDLHRYVLDTSAGRSVDLTATIEQWGLLAEPYRACYGTVPARQVANWYERFGARLFDGNIRRALGVTQVNQRLVETLEREGEHFWYFNNGVTILCRQFVRAGAGGSNRRRGEFTLRGVTVVNGAQTVTGIAEAAEKFPDALGQARVWLRVISLEQAPEGFAESITRANNTQNHVVDRDFVALDPLQSRLRQEFALTLRRTYAIKRGDDPVAGEEGCGVDEATVALACAHPDTRYAVLARSNLGALWDMAEGGAYHVLFTRDLSALAIWRRVIALRRVEQNLAALATERHGRERAVVGQGERLVAHVVLGLLDRVRLDDVAADWPDELDRIDDLAPRVAALLVDHAEKDFADSHVPTLFKNTGRCRQLVALIRADLAAGAYSSPMDPAGQEHRATAGGAERIIFHLSRRGVSARGRLRGSGFVVLAGSLAARTSVPSLRAYPSAITRRAWMMQQGVLVEAPDQPSLLVLTRDDYFDSPSQASAVMLGRPSNGRTDWRTDGGLSLNQALLDS